MKDNIEINVNYTMVLIAYTLNFIVINFVNVLFFYKVILPYFSNKIKKILELDMIKDYKMNEKYKQKYKEDIIKSNMTYFNETLKFYIFLIFILFIINVIFYTQDDKIYIKNLKEFFTFTNIRNLIIMILLSVIVQFLYYKGFVFKYYLYIIYKYMFEILKLN